METKRCPQCGEVKLASAFGRNGYKRDGLATECKPCHAAHEARRRVLHRDAHLESLRRSQARPEYRAAKIAYMREYQRRPEVKAKALARQRVKLALKLGKLVRPALCERCREAPSGLPLEAHHADYARALDVEWVCRRCHALMHSERPELAPYRLNPALAK